MSDRQTFYDDLIRAGAVCPQAVPYGYEIDPAKIKAEWIKPGDFITYRLGAGGRAGSAFHIILTDAEHWLGRLSFVGAHSVTLYPAPARHPDLSPPDLTV